MRNNWLVQGLVSNWLSSLIALAVGGALTYLSKNGSPWTTPILIGLAGSALILVCTIAFRHVLGVNIANIEDRIRIWVDHTGSATNSIAPEHAVRLRSDTERQELRNSPSEVPP
jgi:hypothetical protein